jgi:endonuclease/exonuclease/phosphatase family metal-dependent hydrolase
LDGFVNALQKMKQEDGHSYDLLVLQEVFSSRFFPGGCRQERLVEKLRQAGYIYSTRSEPPSLRSLFARGKYTDSGLLILSRFPIVESAFVKFEHSSGLDSGASKGALFAKVKFGARTLMVFNTHLQASHTSGDAKHSQIRLLQLRALVRFIKEHTHTSPGCPWVLAGDFNVDAISDTQVIASHTHHFFHYVPLPIMQCVFLGKQIFRVFIQPKPGN